MNGRLDANQAGHKDLLSSAFGSRLADAATTPGPAAATTAAATAAAAAPAATATAAPAAAAAPATAASPPGELVAELRFGALLVEDIEGRQADVGKLFLAEENLVVRRDLLRGQVCPRRSAGRSRGAAR